MNYTCEHKLSEFYYAPYTLRTSQNFFRFKKLISISSLRNKLNNDFGSSLGIETGFDFGTTLYDTRSASRKTLINNLGLSFQRKYGFGGGYGSQPLSSNIRVRYGKQGKLPTANLILN